MSEIRVRIKTSRPELLPLYKTAGAAGMDLRAAESGFIPPGGRKLVSTGLFLEIPEGYEGQIRPRSGLALKEGIGMLNAPGTIDADYRGEVKVLLYNSTLTPFYYEEGDRVAQLVFARVARAVLVRVEELSDTERGPGGFGSTGFKS